MSDAEALQQVRSAGFGSKPDVPRHGQMREQSVVLRQITDVSLLGTEVDPADGVEPRLVVQRDVSAAGMLEAGDGTQQRGLPGAGWSDQRDCLLAETQRSAKLVRPPGEGDVDVEKGHVRISSLEVRRIVALAIISSTPTAIAWSRFASNSE